MSNYGKRNWSASLLFVSCISLIPCFGLGQKTTPRLKPRALSTITSSIDDSVSEFEPLVKANIGSMSSAGTLSPFGTSSLNYPGSNGFGSTSPFGSQTSFGSTSSPFGSQTSLGSTTSPFTSNGYNTSPFSQLGGTTTLNNGFGGTTFTPNALPTLPTWGSNLQSSNPFQSSTTFGSNTPFTSPIGGQSSFPFIDSYPGSSLQPDDADPVFTTPNSQFPNFPTRNPAIGGGSDDYDNQDGEWQLVSVPDDDDSGGGDIDDFQNINRIPRVVDVYNLKTGKSPRTVPSRSPIDKNADGTISDAELQSSVAKTLAKILDENKDSVDDSDDYNSDNSDSDDYGDDYSNDDAFASAPSPAPIWKSLKSNGSPRSTSSNPKTVPRKSKKSKKNRSDFLKSPNSKKKSPGLKSPSSRGKPTGLRSPGFKTKPTGQKSKFSTDSSKSSRNRKTKGLPPLSGKKQQMNGRPSWDKFVNNDNNLPSQRGWNSDDYDEGDGFGPYNNGNGGGGPYDDGPYDSGNGGGPYDGNNRNGDGPYDDMTDQRNWDPNGDGGGNSGPYNQNNNGDNNGNGGNYNGNNNGQNSNTNDNWNGFSQFNNGQDSRNWDVNSPPGGIPANVWNRGPSPSSYSNSYDQSGQRDWNFLNPGLGGPLQTSPNLAIGGANPPWTGGGGGGGGGNINYPPGSSNPPFNSGGGGSSNDDMKNWSLDQWYDYYYRNGWSYNYDQKRWIKAASVSNAASSSPSPAPSRNNSSNGPRPGPSSDSGRGSIQDFAPFMTAPSSAPSRGPVRSSFNKRDISTLMSAVDEELKSTP